MNFIDFSDNSAANDIRVIQQHLQHVGFSTTDSEWLVEVFKHPDCFGDPNGDSIFRENFLDDFENFFPRFIENKLTQEIEAIEKDRQTSLALLLSCILKLGLVGGYPTYLQANECYHGSDHSTNVPGWISEFQNHAKFRGEDLNWQVLRKKTCFDDLLSILLPAGVPLDKIVDLDLLEPIRHG